MRVMDASFTIKLQPVYLRPRTVVSVAQPGQSTWLWPRMLGVRIPSLTLEKSARSSTGQSAGLRTRRLRVQVAPGASAGPKRKLSSVVTFCPASSTRQSNGFLIRGLQVRFLRGVSTVPSAPVEVDCG